jgi:hypothetical protein
MHFQSRGRGAGELRDLVGSGVGRDKYDHERENGACKQIGHPVSDVRAKSQSFLIARCHAEE